jgi:hypothetical protein
MRQEIKLLTKWGLGVRQVAEIVGVPALQVYRVLLEE